jgi:hypothetical protein
MPKAVVGAIVAAALLVVAGSVTIAYPFFYRDSLAEPSVAIDDAEGKAWVDSPIVIEVRGSFSEEEIQEALEIQPRVPVGEDDLAVEHIARFPWHEGFPWAKTRVTINPDKFPIFQPETSYTVALKGRRLTFETVTLPRVVDARIDSALGHGFNDVPTSSPIILAFNEGVLWQDGYLDVKPFALVTTTTERTADGGMEVRVAPKERWQNDTAYTLTVGDAVKDMFGHESGKAFSFGFSTWPAPAVENVAPVGDDLPVGSVVRVEFERAVDRATVEDAFSVKPSVSGSFEWENDQVLTWEPSKLQYATTYTVSVAGTAIGGDPIVPSTWDFTTRTRPEVVEAQPAGDGLPEDSLVRVQFDRKVDRKSVEETFQIQPEVSGSFGWESDDVMTWQPGQLDYSTTYTISVGGESVDGDPIFPHQWAFTTQDPPVFVEIEGSDHSPTLLRAVASGGTGEYAYKWSDGETSDEVSADLWYEETRSFEVTVTSGDQTAAASLLVIGPPSPCPKGWQIITEALCYKEETLSGPVRAFVARVDLRDSGLQLQAEPAADYLGYPRTVSESAEARNALLSINGDFFHLSTGEYLTLGPIVSGGNIIYAPPSGEVAFALDGDLNSWVGRADAFGVDVKTPDGASRRIGAINSVPASNGLALFNAYWGTDLSLDVKGCYALFAPTDGTTSTAYRTSCGAIEDVPLRVGEFVLVGTGQAAEWMKSNGEEPLSLSAASPIPDVGFAVGGSHLLIEDGEPGELDSRLSGRHPRTAIGIDDEGFVYFVVVDGRSADSVGMTLVELQEYLSELGLVNAMNLDGGGSSTMVLQQSVMNTPSGGRERAVASVIEVTEQQEACWNELIRCQLSAEP